MLLITGANGKLGRLIVEEVLRPAPDAPLAVSVRDASAAADLADRGVDVRRADYHDLDSMRGVHRHRPAAADADAGTGPRGARGRDDPGREGCGGGRRQARCLP